jgi:serine/threonine-protein kinase
MATVWRAEDEMFGRMVALKLLADDLAGSVGARRRFRHEAEIAMFLDHPAIAPVYAHGEDDGVTWMAMSLIEGQTLAARISRSLVPIDEALRITGAVGDALGYAHGHDVVHRDVTSNNVMIARDGRVFVLDFGLARAEGLSRITSTGVAMGTYGYLAPEVLAGQAADARSDLYGLGIMLYEMLTGATPFAGDRIETVAYRAANEDPEPPSRRRAGLGAGVDAFVLKAIARDPGARFQDAGAFCAALAATAASLGEPAAAGAHASGSEVLARALTSRGVVYLAVAPIECASEALAPLGVTLADAFRARLPGSNRLRVVGELAPADATAWREFARAAGANAILAGRLRESGARVRLELWLTDPEDGAHLAGGHSDGLSFEPFALEDAALDQARAMLGMPGDSATAVTQATRRDPAADEHFAQALRDLERHDHEASVDGAVKLLERLSAADEPRAEWFAALARACLAKYLLTQEHAWEGRAGAALERALAMAPGSPETLLAQADVRANAGLTDEAISGYERVIAIRPDSYEAWYGLARTLDRAGLSVEAESACRRAIEIRPGDWRAYSALGRVYQRQGKWEHAAEAWRRVLELSPDNSRGARDLGRALHELNRTDEAIGLLRRSIDLQPSATAFTTLGTVLFLKRLSNEAVQAFRKATALRPADPLVWGNLGNACRQLPGHETEAPDALDRAIALMRERLARNPGEAVDWARLADWLQVRGRGEEAERAMERAMAMAPDNVDCLLHATFYHHERGEKAKSLRTLRALLAHGYDPALIRRSSQLSDMCGDEDFERLLKHAEAGRLGDPPFREVV